VTAKTAFSASQAKPVKRSKFHQDYWNDRVCQRSYRDGAGREVLLPEWQVYIQHLGRREWFQLGTTVKAAAARKAAAIYASLRAQSWEKTLEVYKPRTQFIQAPTLGEFLESVQATQTIQPKTFALYSRKFRKIVSDVAGVDRGKDKFKHRGADAHKWRSRVDAVRLSVITPEAVDSWRIAHIQARGMDAEKKDSAENTANSAIRNARALFSDAVLSKVQGIQLPKPLPFAGVSISNDRNARYVSRIDPQKLITAAKRNLADAHPEQFKIFLLGLFCGLRRNEIDKLLWRSVDLDKGVIRIEINPYFKPKAASSIGECFLEPEVVTYLRKAKKNATGEFVIESNVEPKLGITYDHYRANEHFNGLIEWLRANGVDTDNPLHTLRKEFGRLLTERHGIYAASKMLRHSSILVTASYYADDQRRLTIGLGSTLTSTVAPRTPDRPPRKRSSASAEPRSPGSKGN
jgi:integrase